MAANGLNWVPSSAVDFSQFYRGNEALESLTSLKAASEQAAKTQSGDTDFFGGIRGWFADTMSAAAADAVPNPAQSAASADEIAQGQASLDLGSWLARIAVVILGFIFVAVGLSMFRNG